MKYLIQMSVPPEIGNELERKPGGPGPIVGRILERFKPECVYMTTGERCIIMVADLDEADACELMIVSSNLGNAYPKLTPVISGENFAEVVSRALPAAHKIVDA